jgi:hypothetical protein
MPSKRPVVKGVRHNVTHLPAPLLAGCSAAYLVSLLRMRHTIMTERLARRGTPAGTDTAPTTSRITWFAITPLPR